MNRKHVVAIFFFLHLSGCVGAFFTPPGVLLTPIFCSITQSDILGFVALALPLVNLGSFVIGAVAVVQRNNPTGARLLGVYATSLAALGVLIALYVTNFNQYRCDAP